MPLAIPLTFAAPAAFWTAAAVFAAAVAIAIVRRPAAPATALALFGLGGLLLVIAAGGPAWRQPTADPVVVMVDLSPSTRTARYRNPPALSARVRELLGDVPHRVVSFAGAEGSGDPLDVSDVRPLPDKHAERTIFTPPAASTVLLFSDGRFETPAFLPPTFVVIDPLLESPADGAVERLEPRGEGVSVTTRNTGGPRELTLSGTADPTAVPVPAGPMIVTRATSEARGGTTIAARLSPGDPWPENDALSLITPPPPEAQRWWVASRPAPSQSGGAWRTFDARHNRPRTGRVVVARGRDAADTAFSTTYGATTLAKLRVWADDANPGDANPASSGSALGIDAANTPG